MACSSAYSKEFNRKELQSLLSSVLDNLDDGKVKKLSDEEFKALFHFLNGRDTFACLRNDCGKSTESTHWFATSGSRDCSISI